MSQRQRTDEGDHGVTSNETELLQDSEIYIKLKGKNTEGNEEQFYNQLHCASSDDE